MNNPDDANVLHFPLPRVPAEASDAQIERMAQFFEDELKPAIALNAAFERVEDLMRPGLNAETLANGRVNEIEVYTHDETGKLTTKFIPRDPEHDAQLRREKQARLEHAQRHVEYVRREITERRLTELDPHWRERFADWKAAELYYAKELNEVYFPKHERPAPSLRVVNGGGGVEPPEFESIPDRSDEDNDVTFDDGLTEEDRDER